MQVQNVFNFARPSAHNQHILCDSFCPCIAFHWRPSSFQYIWHGGGI